MKYQLSSFICMAMIISGCGGSDSKSKPGSSSSMVTNSMSVSSAQMMSNSMMSSSAMPSSHIANSSMAAMVHLKYSILVTNLTAGQPFSPLAYSVHYPGFSPFVVGKPATLGLEKIAESGSADDFLAEAMADQHVLLADHASGLTLPGQTTTLSVSMNLDASKINELNFSFVNMLGNTNDGFSGINSISIGTLAVGESLTLNAMSYDAGTEMNSESQATVPGPAGGGEGFNAMRDDMVDQVTMHPGVVTRDDGKMDSTLTQVHRWDNPVAKIIITRLAP